MEGLMRRQRKGLLSVNRVAYSKVVHHVNSLQPAFFQRYSDVVSAVEFPIVHLLSAMMTITLLDRTGMLSSVLHAVSIVHSLGSTRYF